ncbi:MAG: ABC-F family ATP-binding cassette domain-containing protein [Burkholderiales bacterium]
MIRIRGLTLGRGARTLLEDADAAIAPGERIALIGDNRSGKSTLLAAIAGDLSPDAGDVDVPPMRIARLEQAMPRGAQPAWRFVLEADAALMRAEVALAAAEAGGDGRAIAQAHDDFIDCDGPSAPARARELLDGLGFGPDEAERPVDAFSGGWKMRLNLARVLMAPAELLLLDEPTNHLDLDAVLWLERRLMRSPATIVVVSHDRDFLDRVAQVTLAIEDRRLVRYAGGYSACEQARAERAAQRQRAIVAQQVRIAHLHAFVERFRAKATKAKQAQSRLKALERIEVLAPLRATRGIDFEFAPVGDCPDPLVRMEDVACGYPAGPDGEARPVLRDVSLTVGRGSRIGVLGRNGAGKTTLIRTAVGELASLAGELQRSRTVRIGYFAQQQVDALRAGDTALAHMQRLAPEEREQVLRDWLGRFAFRGDDATRPVGPMSGGERARLALAMLVWRKPQLLVLDEPTNHLDAATRDALADALAEFDGALLLVSHDRYLLRATVDAFVRVADGAAAPFDGDLDDYAAWLLHKPVTGPVGPGAHGAAPAEPAVPGVSRRDERRAAAEQRAQRAAQRRPLQKQVDEIERELARLEARIGEIDARLAEPDAYRDGAAAAELGRERGMLQKARDVAEERWLELSAELEALDADTAG